jgi:hypothetical protein
MPYTPDSVSPGQPIQAATINKLGTQYQLSVNDSATNVVTAASGPGALRSAIDARYPVRGQVDYDVRDFGAKGDGVTDDTAAVQAAINAANASNAGMSSSVYLSQGVYVVSTIVLKKGVTLRGSGRDKTRLYALAGSTAAAVVTIDTAYVDNAFIRDLAIWGQGSGNANQIGVYAYAHAADSSPSGWGSGGMTNVNIQYFDGHSLWLRGGGGPTGNIDRTNWQHQFLKFDHCDFVGTKDNANSNTVRVTGKNGQITFEACQITTSAGTSANSGTNLYIATEQDDSGTIISDSNMYGSVFLNCTIEGREFGTKVYGAFDITFLGTYNEVVGKCFLADQGTRGLSIIGTHWANSGHMADSSGYLVNGAGKSFPTVIGGSTLGTVDKSFIGDVVATAVHFNQSNGQAYPTQYITAQLAVDSNNAIAAYQYKTILLNAPSTLKTINSDMTPGDHLYVKAFGGDVSVSNAGNIDLGGKANPATIPSGHLAEFVKYDLTADWVLLFIT